MSSSTLVTQGTQYSKSYSAHEVNTNTVTYRDNGVFHKEGGWPKDINTEDSEQTVRYRRKIEKDDAYIHAMHQLLPEMEHCILQNNACNIYEKYFEDLEEDSGTSYNVHTRTVNVYRDPLPVKRPITHLSWSPDEGTRFAVSYCDIDLRSVTRPPLDSYIWDVENPNNPLCALKPDGFSNLATEYNPKDSNILVSGLTSGQIALWDVRRGSGPVETSSSEHSHRDSCTKVLWINSKTGTEFFSASKDGQLMWWDTRRLQTPHEALVMNMTKVDEQCVDDAIGISALQFEASMGSRFMCGLENGIVISGNRKGKTPGERTAVRFRAHYGPVVSVERNPTFLKNFLTVGDWSARIWSEDCRESSITWIPSQKYLLTGGTWSTTRLSVFFITKADGTLDIWDFLVQQDTPILSVKVCDKSLSCIRPHEQGQLVAVAAKNGMTYLIELSEAIAVNQKNDKQLFTGLLERETRREKVIEAKNREIRLKMKTTKVDVDLSDKTNKELADKSDLSQHPLLIQCEQDYNAIIEAEMTRAMEQLDLSFDI